MYIYIYCICPFVFDVGWEWCAVLRAMPFHARKALRIEDWRTLPLFVLNKGAKIKEVRSLTAAAKKNVSQKLKRKKILFHVPPWRSLTFFYII